LANPHFPYEVLSQSGEDIPLSSASIDFIYSLEVMEHVQDPKKVLSEIYRLLKKDGMAYISTCNYDSFYEGHYKRFWNPFVGSEGNKKRYVRQGLSPEFFEEINFITKRQLKAYIKECGFQEFILNPRSIKKQSETNLKLNYPENWTLPGAGKNVRPTKWHIFIENKYISNILSLFDRDYKIYLLLKK
jgi:2-polyprenyl-3-methyl-5-hydroxy-6-metoxy-1,4-benzoquinol methylase